MSLTATVDSAATAATDGTAQRNGKDLQLIDRILAKARSVNIRDAMVEIALGIGWLLPELGVTLLGFVLVDVLLQPRRERAAPDRGTGNRASTSSSQPF